VTVSVRVPPVIMMTTTTITLGSAGACNTSSRSCPAALHVEQDQLQDRPSSGLPTTALVLTDGATNTHWKPSTCSDERRCDLERP